MEVKIEPSWKEVLQNEFDKPYFELLTGFVRKEYGTQPIYPPGKLIFNAFNLCPFNQTKVVIIG
ncbi:MAG: uracil-DNA glycosylase, partial [Bacteroidales bacterium]|nr:uracil-DNA glycosylase [Bacteroidales bacterium]